MELATHFLALLLIGLIGAIVWLALLVATGFSIVIVGMGLLAALVLIYRSA
jgi:hypothetical protein